MTANRAGLHEDIKTSVLLEHFLQNVLIVYLFEIGAAVAGTVYLMRTTARVPHSRLFVWYLWLVVIIETIGFYPAFNHFTKFSYMPFVEGTVFERNNWLYNCYNIVKFAVFYTFFIRQLHNRKSKRIFKWITVFFVISAIINLFLTDVFFYQSSSYTYITGAFILMTLIFVYYFELLKSDRILFFYKSLVFYISVGLLLWHVTITPLFIYNKYFTSASPEFVRMHSTILNFSNYFLYGVYIMAFIFCTSLSRKDIIPESRYFKPQNNIQ